MEKISGNNLILDSDENLTFSSTIGEAIDYLVKKFGWHRSTYRNTANFFTDIDGCNDVVFLRRFKVTDADPMNVTLPKSAEVLNLISRDYSTHTELMLETKAIAKWQLDYNQRPRLLFLLEKSYSGKFAYIFAGIYKIDSASTNNLRVYTKISKIYDRAKPDNYKQ